MELQTAKRNDGLRFDELYSSSKHVVELTNRSVVSVWIRLIGSLTHENPFIVLELALDNFVVHILQVLCVLHFGEWRSHGTDIKQSSILYEHSENNRKSLMTIHEAVHELLTQHHVLLQF